MLLSHGQLLAACRGETTVCLQVIGFHEVADLARKLRQVALQLRSQRRDGEPARSLTEKIMPLFASFTREECAEVMTFYAFTKSSLVVRIVNIMTVFVFKICDVFIG